MMETFASPVMERAGMRLERLYGATAAPLLRERFASLVGRYGITRHGRKHGWSERDSLLITYADMLQAENAPPLTALKRFLDNRLPGAISTVHLLPFFPYSSDDGFSVIHYRTVRPDLGDWPDIQAIGERFSMMTDLVLNHVSRQSGWFRDYQLGIAPGCDFFIETDPEQDLAAVTRPRTSPLLTPVMTRHGKRHLWTTFSDDQLDLNFANPDLLFELLDILLLYVAMGAKIIRLDAVAFLWKKPGTTCLHLPETHEIVKLFRDLLELVAPDVILLTETNVPQPENLSYFGNGDEARMVYQFPLPPLLLHALTTGDAKAISEWATALPEPPPGCTFLNFTASHDGIGVRPLQGLVPRQALDNLAELTRARGGEVSFKTDPDGSQSPYELNITWWDALGGDDMQARRFICSQTIPLALRGIPALYFNSLIAASNDVEGMRRTGRARSINRKKWTEQELARRLDTPGSEPAAIFNELVRLLRLRSGLKPFHPDAPQRILDLGPGVLAIQRTAPDNSSLTALSNLTASQAVVPAAGLPKHDLITDQPAPVASNRISLQPYQTLWLMG